MGLFYDDKKILAASWLLNYLHDNHCFKTKSDISEFNGYRANVIKISDISHKTKIYNNEILGQAADILGSNGHINFEVKDLRNREESKVYILEPGRQAVKSSFYKKIILKKWIKRILMFLAAIAVWFGFWINRKKVEPVNNRPTQEQHKPLDTSAHK